MSGEGNYKRRFEADGALSVRDARGQGPLPVVTILPPRPTAPAWDCYSPVAEILWLAADNAQNGVRFPVSSAHSRLKFSGRGKLFETVDPWPVIEEGMEYMYYSADVSDAERAVGLRILAEFGPAGRPK